MNETNTATDSPQGTTTTDTDNQVQAESTVNSDAQIPQTEGTPGPSEEHFFDPNSVPEELKPAYKQMQAAFTKKTQEIAQAKKESEALKAKAEAYSKYEKYVPIIEEMMGNQPAPQEAPEMAALEKRLRDLGYSDEAIEMAKVSGNFLLNVFTQKQETTKQQERLQAGLAEAEKLDPRLNDASLSYQMEDGEKITFGDIVAQFAATDPQVNQDPVGATRRAIKKVDALIGKAKLEGKEELSASARGKAAKFPSTSSSPQSASATGTPNSIQEAAELAKQQLGIH